MYAMVCHSGALGGGHYVSYSKTESGTWFCHNDSACKEVPETSIDKSTAYILLYEREGLSLSGTGICNNSMIRNDTTVPSNDLVMLWIPQIENRVEREIG
jgi:hypothetical protein